MSRILIVEDDLAIAKGLRDNLEFEQHQVFTATDGEEGYTLLKKHAPDLVILDWMMPKLSGVELCRQARAEGFSAPILILSARGQEADRVTGLDVGANDYVSKPFSLKELLARVRALLRHERERHQDEERLNAELQAAAKVQQELFPRVLPQIAGLDYAGVCLPARGVSGDYYDFFSLPGGKLGLLLADVSGKGMSAALLGATLQGAIRSNAAAGTGCGETLSRANALLLETTDPSRYATVFYASYDPATRELTYANAGHCPPMLLRHDMCTRLETLTVPVGLLPDLPVVERTIALPPGVSLVVTSDGVPEAVNGAGEEFSDGRLQLEILQWGPNTAAEICDGIVSRVRNHTHGLVQADDITIIAIKARA